MLPPVKDHPLKALYDTDGWAAFKCEVSKSIIREGFSYSLKEWHPYVALLRHYKAGKAKTYEQSILKDYYDVFQPRDAAEVLTCATSDVVNLRDLHPLAAVTPWSPKSPHETQKKARHSVEIENREEGYTDLSVEDGTPSYGPVASEKGLMEYNRLVRTFNSIQSYGYVRGKEGEVREWGKDINGILLFRNGDYRLLVQSGYHRMAAVAASGYERIPVCFARRAVIRPEDADYWPQVRSGLWSKKDAIQYFNDLFDFDSRKWARERGLL